MAQIKVGGRTIKAVRVQVSYSYDYMVLGPLLALLAGAIAQWVRPLPASTLEIQGVRLPGTTPTFAWPSTGEAAAAVEGSGTLGEVRGSQPVPVAGLIVVMVMPIGSRASRSSFGHRRGTCVLVGV